MLIKYSQNYNLFVFVFNSTEVRTETLTIFCVMILLLVDTWPDFGLFRVVRPYNNENIRFWGYVLLAQNEALSCFEQYIF